MLNRTLESGLRKVTGLSPDGRWWWNGQTWLPAATQDGMRRFDGVAWKSIRPVLDWPQWLVMSAVVWLLLLFAWLPAGVVLYSGHNFGIDNRHKLQILVVILSISVLATCTFGFLLGYQSRWRKLGVAIPAGTATQLFSYAVAMVIADPSLSDPDAPSNDTAAGAGIAISAIPTLVAIALMLGLGAAAATLLVALRQRHAKPYG